MLSPISTHHSIHIPQVNILVDVVDNVPHARIMDFGIAIVTKNMDSIRPATRQEGHTPRWSAPEIFLGQNPSEESDIYSFAMVMTEVQLRMIWNLRCFRLLLPHQHRYSLVRLRSMTCRMIRQSCWPCCRASVLSGLHILPAQRVCGR